MDNLGTEEPWGWSLDDEQLSALAEVFHAAELADGEQSGVDRRQAAAARATRVERECR